MSCSAQLCPRHLRLRRLRRQHPPPPPPASARCVGSLLDSDRLRTFFFCSDRGLRFTGRVRRTTNLRGGLVGHLPGEMPQRAIPGGLYSKLAVWDFSKERTLFSIDYGSPELQNGSSSCSAGQRFNPAFVHSIAVSEEGVLGGLYKVCAVARGDGALDAIDLKYELEPAKSKCPSRAAGSTVNSKRTDLGDAVIKLKGEGSILITQWVAIMQLCLLLNRAFSALGEKGKFLVSGGNDASVKLWDWSKGFSSETNSNGELFLDIDVKKKVNWLCTAPTDSDNLIVCDTSKVVKLCNFP